MTRLLLTLIALAATGYLALCAWLFFSQRSMIYFPQPRSNTSAPTMKLSIDGVDVFVTTRTRQSDKALLYFGGNAEDVTLSLAELEKAFPDHALYLMHYRGYGDSGGAPTETSLKRDAIALFDAVRPMHSHITVMGRSLGSGVAIKIASERPVSGLVLVTPYYSLVDIGAEAFPHWPVRWLLRDKYETWRYAPQVKTPTLLLAAEHDEIIPRASTELLLRSFSGDVAKMQTILGADHNTISAFPDYIDALRSFAEKIDSGDLVRIERDDRPQHTAQ
ncbi:MAG TPA: alpha/beta hydrolase [Burkholderiales bacterium]|jgi:uncharacterized protein|nr:alpha/beta hydrolase [Burkholderiales bacterium]